MAKTSTSKKPQVERGTSVVAPSARVFDDWSPARIRAAISSAESGQLTNAVLCCDWLLTDDRIGSALNSRCDALMGLEPDFEPNGDKRRSNRAVKALEAGQDFWTSYPEHFMRALLKWGILLGVAPARHYWQYVPGHSGRVLPVPEFWHPLTLRQDPETRRWFIRDSHFVEHEVVAGDGLWILHTPFGVGRPWAEGAWRSLARWVLVKHYAMLDRARHGEKASTLVATSPDGATQEQRRELAEDLKNSGTDRVVALAAGFDLKLVEVTADTQKIYDAQIEGADKAIAIFIRGGNLSTQVDGGSRAAAEVQERTGDEAKLRFDALSLSNTLQPQSLSWWAGYNFGDPNLAPWPAWPVEPEEDKSKAATTIKTLGEGLTALDRLGYEFDDKALAERFKLDFITGRRERPEPVAPTPDDPSAVPKAPPDDGGAPEKEAKAGALLPRLASGASAQKNAGFISGQLYTDAVVDDASTRANEALEPTIEAIAKELQAADSYEDLRERLRALYRDELDGAELSELVFRAMMLGEMAGRRAVTQDS